MQAANRHLDEVYRPAFNVEFQVATRESGSAFVPRIGANLDEILCEHFERTADPDQCVRFETLKLQIPDEATAAITSRPRWRCIAMPMVGSRCSIARGFWAATSAMAR